MKQNKLLLLAVVSLGLVGFALYLQHVQDMQPCPLCVIQRYAFILFAIGCLIAVAGSNVARKIGILVGFISTVIGASVASYQLYVIDHPDIKCGVDPIQTAVNNLPLADWLPSVFYAEGMCGAYYDPILGLSIPQWALVWFVVFFVTLCVQVFRSKNG